MRRVIWLATTLEDIKGFPRPVQRAMVYALDNLQRGGIPHNAKPLKGFGGPGVVGIIENHDGEAYRCVVTFRIGNSLFVLHAFHKKSHRGISTPLHDLGLIKARLQQAQHYEENLS